jgi:hypothetical protein
LNFGSSPFLFNEAATVSYPEKNNTKNYINTISFIGSNGFAIKTLEMQTCHPPKKMSRDISKFSGTQHIGATFSC